MLVSSVSCEVKGLDIVCEGEPRSEAITCTVRSVHDMLYCTLRQRFLYMYKYMYWICWKLLSNQNFKGPYLEAEVVEEVIGWLG